MSIVESSGNSKEDRLLERIYTLLTVDIPDQGILNLIETEFDIVMSQEKLNDYKKKIIEMKRNYRIELESYMNWLVEHGMYHDVRKQMEMTNTMISHNMKFYTKAVRDGNEDRAQQWTNILIKQFDDNRKIFTSMGYLKATKDYITEQVKGQGKKDSAILIQGKEGENPNDQVISKLQLEQNEVF